MLNALYLLSTATWAAYGGPVEGDVENVWMEPDYTICWESQPGKVYQIFWTGFLPTGMSPWWMRATDVIVTSDTVTKWKDEGDGLTRSDPAGENVLVRYYKVVERLDTYYVATNDPNASDSNPGTEVLPFKTIQRAANEVRAGAVVLVKEGTYRERVTLLNEGSGLYEMITFATYPGHEVYIKGSDIYDTWMLDSGSIYKNDDYSAYKRTTPGYHVDLVFDYWDLIVVDGQYNTLQQVLTKGEMTAGTFYNDVDTSPARDDTLYVWLPDGSDPNNHTIECAIRPNCFWPDDIHMAYIRISGFKIREFSNGAQQGAIDTRFGSYWIIDNNEISYCNGTGIQFSGYNNIMRDNKLNDNGCNGAMSSFEAENWATPQNLLVENNEFMRNNWKGYPQTWAAAGYKLGWNTYSTFRNNTFVDNDGPGLWFDWCNYEVDIYDNYFDNNSFQALRLEVCQYMDVYNNVFMNTREEPTIFHRGAIYCMGDHNRIAHNLFYNNGNAIHLWNAGFPSQPTYDIPVTYYGTEDNEIYNNIFYDNNGAYHFSNASPDSNTFDYNIYDGVGGYKGGVYVGAGYVDDDYWRWGYTGEQVHSGKAAYLFHDFGSNFFVLSTKNSFGITSAPYKAEGWFYVPSGSSINNMKIFDGDKKLTVIAAETGPATVNVSGVTTSVSRDAWHSFEMYRVNETTLEVRINGVLLNTFGMSSGVYAQSFQFGDGSGGAGSWGKFYFDDIKIYNGPTIYFEENCEDAGGPNDLFDSAELVDFAGGNYHLLPSSPAIDAGLYQSFAPIDRDGVTRSDPPEIGLYEYAE